MKKNTAAIFFITLVAITTALPAEAGGRRNYNNNNKGNVNGWAAAAVGAIVGVAIGSAIANNNSPSYSYSQPNYNNFQASPYYAPQRACVTTQVPVYDQFGRIVQYRQVCAN